MIIDHAITQRHHIFKDEFSLTPVTCSPELSPHKTLYEAVNTSNNKKYFLLKADSQFATDEQKYLFIKHAEKASELIHPVILPLLGFSDSSPDLYFEYYPGISPISEQIENLDDTWIQNIILGIISGLSYLISKGFSLSKFSLDTIFFSPESGPKFINYVNPNSLEMDYSLNQLIEKCDEKVLVLQVGQIMCELYNRRCKKEGENDVQIPDGLDPNLAQYIKSCYNTKNDRPTLTDLFNSLTELFKGDPFVQYYLTKLDSADKFRYDHRVDRIDYTPFKIQLNDDGTFSANMYFDNNVNILHACYIQEDVFSHKEYFPLLNRLPDSEIKLLLQNQKNPPKLFYEFLCYEREYLLLPPEYKKQFYSDKPEINFLIYQKLMEKTKTEEEPNNAIYPIALKHLKMAAKKNNRDAKIKLAIHYLKGDLVPANFDKSLKWLKSVAFGNKEDVSRYINPINDKIQEIEAEIHMLKLEQKSAIRNADDGKLLYILYVAFSFYSGINHFPVSASKAVHYYRQAAKLSPYFMCLLGGMYLQGYIFPRNLIRARHCFEKAALKGSVKAKILDSLMRKHVWRYYLSDVSIETIYNKYMQCPESLSFDDTFIFPEINFLIQNMQDQFIYSAPYMSSFYFYDRRNDYGGEKKNEMKLAINTIDFIVPTLSDEDINNDDIRIIQFYSLVHVINKLLSSNILPQKITPIFHEEKRSWLSCIFKFLYDITFGFFLVLDDNENEEIDITRQNMMKLGIMSDIESNLSTAIQNKHIPVDEKDGKLQFSTFSYVPQLSLPVAESRLRELKKVIDDNFEVVMIRIMECDKEKYFPTHINVPNQSIEEYIKNQEKVLRETMKDHMPNNRLFQEFITDLNNFEVYYSEPIIYTSKINNVDPEDVKTQLFLAESYFNGENGFPVNYTEAAKYFKMAADKGNSDAQWKYAQLTVNGLGTKQDGRSAYLYMKKSAEQEDPNGMLRFGLFIRHFIINHGTKEHVQLPSFQKYLEKSAETGNIDAINQLAMILETNYSYEDGTAKSVTKYENSIEKGFLDAFFRIIHIYDNPQNRKKYINLVKFAVGMCDHDITKRMIQINKFKKRYEQSLKLINVGLCFDKDAFLPEYAKHIVLYSGNTKIKDRIAYAKSLLTPTLENPSHSVIKNGYLENYLMAMLTILNRANEYEEACQLFIKNMNCLTTKSKKEFIYFYMQINKKVARKYQLSINSYLPEYRACVDAFLLIKKKGFYVKRGNDKLKLILQENSTNQFALLKRGKILLKNNWLMRRNIPKALDYIQKAAKQNCPEARFEYGKELYYGQIIPMNRFNAFKYFKLAFDISNRDPRAGYFLSKKCYIQRNLITKEEAEDCLKVACKFGYRRALFKLGKRFFYEKGNKNELGIILIKKARDQQYHKSIEFLNLYESGQLDYVNQEDEEDSYFAFAEELYYGKVIAQEIQMSFCLFMKFMTSKEPDYRAGYYLSKKKFIQMELISPTAARNALVLSAKANYKRALFKLGKLYYTHEGKKEKGMNLLRKAKKQNYQKAIDFLKRIKEKPFKIDEEISEDDSSVFIPIKQHIFEDIKKLKSGEEEDHHEKMIENLTAQLKEIKTNVPAHKSGTVSNVKVNYFNFLLNLKKSSSIQNQMSDLKESLLAKLTENDDDEINDKDKNQKNVKKKRINLDDPVTSDFSDEPSDDNDN
ncbi:hypothetical protein M9Y10_014835 [Tritrichomonas musculus]|uniref:Protein kinase domain-containing protein n=1 Tax=Tritrichomonas musculus TaxID=1915356 RepID=A0ABR2L0L4_9EUKA